MSNQHVMTLENPAGLLITPEILEQIGVSTGDRIEISVSESALIVRSLTVAETERAGGGKEAMDKIMHDLLERRRAVYEKLAEGAQ